MRTLDMEIAVMKDCNVRQNIVVPNVSYGITRRFKDENNEHKVELLHECDILKLTLSGYATEYEIKVSKRDFLADFKKKHGHKSRFIKYFYYVVPESLLEFAKQHLPEDAGLAYVVDTRLRYSVNAPRKKEAFKWNDSEILKLARLGTMRILTMKKIISKLGK